MESLLHFIRRERDRTSSTSFCNHQPESCNFRTLLWQLLSLNYSSNCCSKFVQTNKMKLSTQLYYFFQEQSCGTVGSSQERLRGILQKVHSLYFIPRCHIGNIFIFSLTVYNNSCLLTLF